MSILERWLNGDRWGWPGRDHREVLEQSLKVAEYRNIEAHELLHAALLDLLEARHEDDERPADPASPSEKKTS